MSALSPPPHSGAFPNTGVLRERFSKAKDSVIENALGKQESWAKKVGQGLSGVMLDDIPKLLAALDLRLVDTSMVCVDQAIYSAYRTLARAAVSEPEKLVWDEPE